MAKFIYRMQNILELKMKLETQAENAFAAANAELFEEEKRLEALMERQAGYETHLEELYAGLINVLKVKETQDAIEIMKLQIDAQRLLVEQAQHRVDIARQKLQKAIQERKTHEKLRENAFEVFLEEEKAEESKMIDELVSYRFGQGKNSGDS
ncbi:MAG: flagellar export protein FliJ [Lachnospiraceae bacterium]|nr:flagellar export protein FliJ [Lachnospiraceae bacterium]